MGTSNLGCLAFTLLHMQLSVVLFDFWAETTIRTRSICCVCGIVGCRFVAGISIVCGKIDARTKCAFPSVKNTRYKARSLVK